MRVLRGARGGVVTARLHTLPAGTSFRVGEVVGRLVKKNPGAAVVELDRPAREFTTRAGDHSETVRIAGGKERTTWALNSEVDVIR